MNGINYHDQAEGNADLVIVNFALEESQLSYSVTIIAEEIDTIFCLPHLEKIIQIISFSSHKIQSQ